MRRALALLVLAAFALPAASADHPALVPSQLGPARTAPIVILGDAGFLGPPDVSGVRGGLGHAGDPFLIEGWTLQNLPLNPTPTGLGYNNVWLPCILLANTQAHAVIRHNVVKGNNCHGIWLQNVSNVTVERNEVLHNTGIGIFAEPFGAPDQGRVGRHVVIRDNVVRANGLDGVRVFYAQDAVVERNLLVANANFGLFARGTDGIRVLGNTAHYNEVSGFFVELSVGALVQGNEARWNVIGFNVEMGTDGALVRWNTASDNRDLGIYTAIMAMNTRVEGNLVERNGLLQEHGWNDGIALNGVMDGAYGNVVRGNRDGIAVGPDSVDVEVDGNLVEANARGVVLEACPCEVYDNALRGNGVGLAADVAGCGDVRGNNLEGNGVGAASPHGGLDAAGNWWGSASGPRAADNPEGSGDAVLGGVHWSPFLASPNPAAP